MAERQPTGSWAGHAQYRCRWCAYDVLADNGPTGLASAATAIDLHEQDRHPDQYLESLGVTRTPAPAAPPPEPPTTKVKDDLDGEPADDGQTVTIGTSIPPKE